MYRVPARRQAAQVPFIECRQGDDKCAGQMVSSARPGAAGRRGRMGKPGHRAVRVRSRRPGLDTLPPGGGPETIYRPKMARPPMSQEFSVWSSQAAPIFAATLLPSRPLGSVSSRPAAQSLSLRPKPRVSGRLPEVE
jgi:hypothetical protein